MQKIYRTKIIGFIKEDRVDKEEKNREDKEDRRSLHNGN